MDWSAAEYFHWLSTIHLTLNDEPDYVILTMCMLSKHLQSVFSIICLINVKSGIELLISYLRIHVLSTSFILVICSKITEQLIGTVMFPTPP